MIGRTPESRRKAIARARKIANIHPEIVALQERKQTAMILAFLSFLGGLIGTNRLLEVATNFRLLPREVSLWMLIVIILVTSVPNIIWLFKYRRDRFGNGNE